MKESVGDHIQVISGIAEEEDRLPTRPMRWLILMIIAAVVGVVTGLVGVAFRITLMWADFRRNQMISFVHAHLPSSIGWIVPMALCALGAGLGLWLTQTLAPQTAGSGIPRVEAVLRNHLRPAGLEILPVKFFGGALSIGSGLALGREGPTVQMGGTVGRLIGDGLANIVSEPWTFIAAGAGAGLAVAFNAPLAAALFVVEELLHRFSTRVFSATLVACITGTVVLRAFLGDTFDFGAPALGALSARVLPEYLLLGLVAGLVGVVYNQSLLASLRLFDLARNWPRGAKGAVVGAGAGLLAYFAPPIVGGGENLGELAIVGHIVLSTALWLLVIRFVLSMVSYGSGAPGGVFAPLLALGGILGQVFVGVFALTGHLLPQPAAFAIVSMAALFTATIRSPLTGVVLMLEMTGGWTLILPMMAACVLAYAIPELLRNPPLYDSLRDRDVAVERKKRAQAGGEPQPNFAGGEN
jgi:CIC family chloride channel protein